ncbi:MAG: thioredoxin family protein [Ferruginibacter sp.]|nr:thioredoxin family protein [Ferruginibacter sp.]
MPKNIIALFVFFVFFTNANAQSPYTNTINDRKETVLNGIITKYVLANNEPFKSWYNINQNAYTVDLAIVSALETAKGKVQFIIFGGTWCEDTQFILPKFFKLQEKAGFADDAISFYGVDRAKKTLGNLNDAFKITNVPTIIVMKDGKEIGRVVEYGKTGKWDVEIAAILKK